MPYLIGVFRQFDAVILFAVLIEQAELYAGSMGGKNGKIHPQPIPGRPEWYRFPLSDARDTAGIQMFDVIIGIGWAMWTP